MLLKEDRWCSQGGLLLSSPRSWLVQPAAFQLPAEEEPKTRTDHKDFIPLGLILMVVMPPVHLLLRPTLV